jgi:hypothetical protein
MERDNTVVGKGNGRGGIGQIVGRDVKGWCQGRKRGRFDGVGGDGGRKLLHTALYCRVPSTPHRFLKSMGFKSLQRLSCNLSRYVN